MSVRSRWWVDGGEELRIPLERLLSGTNGDPLLYVKGPLQEPAQSFFDSSGNGVRDVFTGRRVCMFVYNDFRHDARVLKEANSLQEAGYDLTVVALLSEGLPRLSRQGGVKVLRVPKNPIHLRFLRALRTATLLDAVRRRCRRAFSACMTWLPGPGAPDQATVLNPDPATLGSYVKWLGGNALSLISLFLFPLWVSVRLLARILGTSLPDSGLPRPDDWEDLPFQQKLLWQAKRFVAYERRRRRELKRLLGLSWSRLGRWHRLTRKSLTLPLLWVRQQRRLLRSGWIRLSTPWLRAARRRWRLSRKSLTLPLRWVRRQRRLLRSGWIRLSTPWLRAARRRWRLSRKSLTLPLRWVRRQRRLLRSGWIRLSTPWLRATRRRWRLSRKSVALPLRWVRRQRRLLRSGWIRLSTPWLRAVRRRWRLIYKSVALPLRWVRRRLRLLRSGWIRLSTPWLRAVRRRWRLIYKSVALPLRWVRRRLRLLRAIRRRWIRLSTPWLRAIRRRWKLTKYQLRRPLGWGRRRRRLLHSQVIRISTPRIRALKRRWKLLRLRSSWLRILLPGPASFKSLPAVGKRGNWAAIANWGKSVLLATRKAIKTKSRPIRKKAYDLALGVLMRYHRVLCFLDYYARASKALTATPADFYHAHDLNTLPVAYWLARKNRGKLIYDSHEFYLERNMPRAYSRYSKFLRQILEGFLVRRSDLTITVNETISNELGRLYKVRPFKVIMNTPSLVQPARHEVQNLLRDELHIPNSMKILLYSGAITFNRGLPQLMESLNQLRDCVVVLMGPGRDPFKQQLRQASEELGVSNRVYFFGPVPSDQVTTYASGADVGVAPIDNVCLSYYYCSPNKIFEYILAGLPVIASDFPEMRRVVQEYGVGLTFDPSDPVNIARAARGVLDEPELRERVRLNMSEASRVFNWENESRKLLAYYEAI